MYGLAVPCIERSRNPAVERAVADRAMGAPP
jgi:hypothetical protein